MEAPRIQGVTQVIAYTTTVPITNAFGAQTRMIRLCSDTSCHYHVYDVGGTAAAVVATDPLLPLFWVEYVKVSAGQKISAIQHTAGGNLYVTEIE